MDMKIIAVIAAVVLVAGGVGAYFVMNGSDDGGSDGKDFDMASGALLIYGNANEDSTIDASDVTAIEKLIEDGEYTKTADANMDGSVDSEDVEIVKKIIAGEQTELYYQDMTDGARSVEYPITSFMGIHQFVLIPMMAIGSLQYMDGYTLHSSGANAATMLQELYDTETNVNTSYNMVDVEKLSALEKKPKYIMTYSKSLSNENKLEKSGIVIIHLDFSDFYGSVSAIRTAGYLLNLADNANGYVSYVEDMIEDVKTKVLDKIPEEQRKKVMCGYMTNCIDHKGGSYTPMAEAAGGIGVMDEDENTYVEFNRGDEWILSYNEDVFFYMNSWGYSSHIDLVEFYKKSADYFTGLTSYKSGNFVVINSVMPPVLTVAYMAEAMYPDLVGTGYGDAANQDFLENFFPSFAAGYTASDYNFFITYDMVKGSL